MVHLPGVVDCMFGLMNRLSMLQMWMAIGIKGPGQDRGCSQTSDEGNTE